MFWDKEYESHLQIWGDRPSELAIIIVKYLQSHQLNDKLLSIIDIGCGYGRDCLYLTKHLNCCIFGIDTSQKAIEIPKEAPPTYGGKSLKSSWKVSVKIDILLSRDIHAEKDVEVER